MRFLVTGYTGQLGYDVTRELKKRGFNDIISVGSEDMDVTKKENVIEKIVSLKPDVIFHNAAYTNVDGAEENYEACYNVNVLGTENIVEAAQKVGAKVVYISTDYVFDGTKDGIYEVDDITNPKNVYGKTKYLGELEARKYNKHFIVRISWVFGINGKNFIKTMLRLAETKTELNVVADQVGSPTYTVDLAKLLVDMSLTERYGTYHATNEGYCSWAEFAKYIFEINGKDVKVNEVTTAEYVTKATRPLNSRLGKQSLTENGFQLLPSWKDATKRYCDELGKEKVKKI